MAEVEEAEDMTGAENMTEAEDMTEEDMARIEVMEFEPLRERVLELERQQIVENVSQSII